MSGKGGGVGYGLVLVLLALVAVWFLAGLVDPHVIPEFVREKLCVRR